MFSSHPRFGLYEVYLNLLENRRNDLALFMMVIFLAGCLGGGYQQGRRACEARMIFQNLWKFSMQEAARYWISKQPAVNAFPT